jgi:hypothetical protein
MDLALLAPAVRRLTHAPAAEVRALERVTLAARLLVLVLDTHGADSGELADLAREARALSLTDGHVVLVQPAGGGAGSVRVEIGARQFALPAVLRDALLAALAQREAANEPHGVEPQPHARQPAAAAAQAAASAADPAARARAWALAVQLAAASESAGAADPAAAARPAARAAAALIEFMAPLLDGPGAADAERIAQRLHSALERSGLFFEAHVAQWARGERDVASVQNEMARLIAPRREPGAPLLAGGDRIAAQLDVLQRQTIALHGPAWPGQSVELALGRDPDAVDADAAPDGAGDARRVFCATLRMRLPALGALTIKLRLAGNAVAAHVETAQPRELGDELASFGAQLEARGLQPAALTAAAPEAPVQAHDGR